MNSVIQAKKERHIKFYELDLKVKPTPLLWCENMQGRFDSAASAYELAMSRLDWLYDDFIPYASCVTGTEIFAEAFGSKVVKPENTNPYSLPFITEASEVPKIKVPKLEEFSVLAI